ncbi:DODA-type extradiol aromatic ring-opening family dioxygenase [Thauera linaloolentis]|uniref:Extradiol ring-cleavage dioxygenase class III enzyme subunit B domain-containing protein n=1 Tax=Thauera linaloolentis (strain DSM 12138 / JCM 21573 / CCUG 41526 / CIP 105981 / IAM 15112 / NBRC 102519 / 47Lol) TaxID=1123367 RepID=N6YPL1_THAL4|nr:class III extradiol ring-cleavage dioxygenase [Thauera linaloolentis]ENO84168.1 hypothetical protein C666_17800 [Thauera linaloolentis 47Lol = DSM 12138]MCM8565890.1 dioxygenase [Thauera linaloolentis]
MTTLPSLFVSHGSPMFALEPGIAGGELHALGRKLPRPEVIVIASPHWMAPRLSVTSAEHPETIHDFGGFPKALYELEYPAAGSPVWAQRVLRAFDAAGIDVQAEPRRGLDHGAWVPLMHMYPDADIPVVQVSLHPHFGPAHHLQLGRALAPLREQGALLIGSGSLTHNLYELRRETGPAQDYVQAFAGWIAATLAAGDTTAMLDYRARAPHAERAHPTDEHLLPLLFAMGAAGDGWRAQRMAGDDVRYGTLAMDGYVFDR